MVLSTSDATTEITFLLQSILASVPPGVNAVGSLRVALHTLVHPTYEGNFRYQLYCVSAVLALTTAIMLVALLLKWRKHQLWLFRLIEISGVRCIVPHYSMMWAVAMALCTALLQGFIWNNIAFIHDTRPVWDFALWKTLVWYPAWLAFWFATHSMAASHLLFVDSSQTKSKTVFYSPHFLNALGVGVPLSIFIIVVVFALKGSQHYKSALSTYLYIDGALAQYEPLYNGTFPEVALQSGVTKGSQMLVDFDYFREYFMATFITFSIASMAVIITFLGYSFVHLRALAAAVGEVSGPSATPHEAAVKKRYHSILRVSLGFLFISVCLLGICLYIAGDTKNIILDPAASSAAILAGLYLLAVIGLPVGILLCVIALDQTSVEVLADAPTSDDTTTKVTAGKDWSTPPEVYQMQYQTSAPTGAYSPDISDSGLMNHQSPHYQSYPTSASPDDSVMSTNTKQSFASPKW